MVRIENYDLSGRNTFRMKVKCALFVEYETVGELESIDWDSLPRPVISVGAGSNLLFAGDFPGTVLHSAIRYIKYVDMGLDSVPVMVGAGVKFDDFVAKACADNLWGVENLSLIPGDVGAAAVQNIGAYGVEAADVIDGVTCYDTVARRMVKFKAGECGYGYRESIFKKTAGRYVITGVLFRLSRSPKPRLEYKGLSGLVPKCPQDVRNEVIRIRRSKLPDPEELGSAGSFFKNPMVPPEVYSRIAGEFPDVPHYATSGGDVKVPAAWLIENSGMKGRSVGGAAVYGKQPLVIVNASGDATPSDVLALEKMIVEAVRSRFGIELHPEVEHIGL